MDTQRTEVKTAVSNHYDPDREEWCVYVLECEQPLPRKEMEEFLSKEHPEYPTHASGFEYGPNWTMMALRGKTTYYAGMTNDVVTRISEHIRGRPDGAIFTTFFPPVSIHRIESCNSRSEANRRESEISTELTQGQFGEPEIEELIEMMCMRMMRSYKHYYDPDDQPISGVTKGSVFTHWLEAFESAIDSSDMLSPAFHEAGEEWLSENEQRLRENSIDRTVRASNTVDAREYWTELTTTKMAKYLREFEHQYEENIHDLAGELVYCYSF